MRKAGQPLMNKISLQVAGAIIRMESPFPMVQFTAGERGLRLEERFTDFFYRGGAKPDIRIRIDLVDRLTRVSGETIFITRHFIDGRENWRLLKDGENYYYKEKRKIMRVNGNFDDVDASLLIKKKEAPAWDTTDIIYDFLQVLLLHFFALRKSGILAHSVGIRDIDGQGILFAGESGAGKSTLARIWRYQSRAAIINDDRIIVRKTGNRFSIHGTPWHGEFDDYLESRRESAPLKAIFIIRHEPANDVRRLTEKEAFKMLYPALFPTFWDRTCLNHIVSLTLGIVQRVPCFSLGFVKDEKIIDFVRAVME
jgi:hypothetical protein